MSKHKENTEVTKDERAWAEARSRIDAIDKVMAVAEFDLDGHVLDANDIFLRTMGYKLAEIKDEHHRIFVDENYGKSRDYKRFWSSLNDGQFQSGEFRRVTKDGSVVWLQASYNPIYDEKGELSRIVKLANDITETKLEAADSRAKIDAIDKVMAVIEFDLDGTILEANPQFLATMGYRLDEIRGKHHRIFVDAAFSQGREYQQFWADLNQGQHRAGEFRRVAKGGRAVWLQASYNPVYDADGRPVKVIKYATDITESKMQNADTEAKLETIAKVMGVIEFDMQGNILDANELFCRAIGYSIDEIQGRHHRMFVEHEFAQGREYQQFWADLNAGKYQTGEFKRVTKAGKDLWLQASYNPVLDADGHPVKVVKFASDITERKEAEVRERALTEDLRGVLRQVTQHAISLSNASGELSNVSEQLATNAEETASQATQVSAAAEQVSRNLSNVASGTEEVNLSIREIAKSADEAASVANGAVGTAKEATDTISKLGTSSNEIGVVVKVITSIAQQTNLLALNATIEAARAGEAGKGFAVVANEVKELAKETARATEDISSKIAMIQSDTEGVINAMNEISATITQINDIQTTIAASVEEQTATVGQITRNVGEAAKGSGQISENISSVAQVAHGTTKTGASVQSASGELSNLAGALERLVAQFEGGDDSSLMAARAN